MDFNLSIRTVLPRYRTVCLNRGRVDHNLQASYQRMAEAKRPGVSARITVVVSESQKNSVRKMHMNVVKLA